MRANSTERGGVWTGNNVLLQTWNYHLIVIRLVLRSIYELNIRLSNTSIHLIARRKEYGEEEKD